MQNHQKYMQRCLDLAKNGQGSVAPNPMVGAVVVHNNRIIGEGWHQKSGQPHAEVNAINSVKNLDLLSQSTIYVSLEPCAHFGKTPPCADLIVKHNIPQVVVGTTDPNPQVAGKGIKRIKDSGAEVIVHVLKEQCDELNKTFFGFHTHKKPFITLKWAQTKNGFIDIKRDDKNQGSFAISGFSSKVFVHKLRATHDAILIGPNTAIHDNPTLNTRWYGGKSPVRLILDRKNRLPKTLNIFNDNLETWHFIGKKSSGEKTEKSIQTSETNFIKEVLNFCYKKNIQSILVEGGAEILSQFIVQNLWEEALVLKSNKIITEGLLAPHLNKMPNALEILGEDELTWFKNT